jgi:hypothetical protein
MCDESRCVQVIEKCSCAMLDFLLCSIHILWMSKVMVIIESQMGFISFLYLEIMNFISWPLKIHIQ